MSESSDKKKRGINPTILLKLLVFGVFAIVVAMQGIERVQAANALTGSTALTFSPPPIVETTPDVDSTEPDGPVAEKPEPTTPTSSGSDYTYIDEKRLDEKTATDLAVWYLNHFPDERKHNESALGEFNTWLEVKTEADPAFSTSYSEALTYVRAHPELLTPAVEDEPTESDEPSIPTDTTPPSIPTATNPGIGGSTATASPAPSQKPQVTPPTQSTSKYPNIDEAFLASCTAAEVANWVYKTFPPESSSWNYQALSDYYSWLDAKGVSDSAFKASVNSYLDIMGWKE